MHDDSIPATRPTSPPTTPGPAPATAMDADPTSIAPRLRREWQHLRFRRDLVAAARGWHVTDVEFDDLQHLLTLAGSQRGTGTEGDEVLRALVERAVDDELAARIVLQRILPGLLSVVRRRRRTRRCDGVLEELVGAAWIAIRTFDVRRRPACLAAALICGAEHHAFRGPARRRSTREVSLDPRADRRPTREPTSAADELADVLRWACLQGLSDDDATFVRRLATAESPRHLAAELGVTTRTVRNRRDQVTYRLRRLSVAA